MNKIETVIKVGIADLNFVQASDSIRTSGLGSCVGVIIYDTMKQIAGLAHVMLPDSTLTKQKDFNVFKYADTAIDYLMEGLMARNVPKYRMKAKIAGGAQMFQHQGATDVMRIGPRNVEVVVNRLAFHQIPIIASDVGGNSGRTIEFNPVTAELRIRTVNKNESII